MSLAEVMVLSKEAEAEAAEGARRVERSGCNMCMCTLLGVGEMQTCLLLV